MAATRFFIALLIISAVVSCKQKTTTANSTEPVAAETAEAPDTTESKAIPAEQLITAGESIGHIKVGEDLDSVMNVLGRPDATDAAMGSSLNTWFAGHDTSGYRTSVFSGRNMGGKDERISHVKKILITSPWFKTSEYISTGNTLADIKKYYTVKKGNSYQHNGESIATYTDLAKGISFEIDPSYKCVSILVHRPNEAADAYINMH